MLKKVFKKFQSVQFEEEKLKTEKITDYFDKDQFLSKLSHEIRTPMNGIIGITNMVLDSDLNNTQKENMKLIKLSAETLIGVINQLFEAAESKSNSERLEGNLFPSTFSIAKKIPFEVSENHTSKKNSEVKVKVKELRILLAEDNYINQKVAMNVLEKLGWSVTLVQNGRELLDIYKVGDFDLILTDVHMPEVDGFELTKEIRNTEKKNGGHVPIVAMTALATMSDKYKCLDAGMDGFISKPIKPDELFKTIEAITHSKQENQPSVPTEYSPCDFTTILENLDGDKQVLAELIEYFIKSYPTDLEKLEAHIRSGDEKQVENMAHYIKSALVNLGGKESFELALKIEMMGKNKQLDQALDTFNALKEELERFEKYFSNPDWLKQI